jgi:hypothetical protein
VVRREEPPCAERAGDRDREESDRSASEHRDGSSREILCAGREHGVPEGLLQTRDLGRELAPVVPPDDGGRNRDEVGEAAVAVDPQDLSALAHVRAAGSALEADPARDVALRGHVLALLDVADVAADGNHGPAELVAERQRRLHPLRRPRVPAVDVEVGSADARRLDADEHLVGVGVGYGNLLELEPGPGPALADRAHGFHGATILPRAPGSAVERAVERSALGRW